LGGDYFERRDKTKVATRLIQRLTDPGLHVEVRSATELFLSSRFLCSSDLNWTKSDHISSRPADY
ncbi:MAG: hypothetical protein AB1671_27815, partial [Thermodesulfobacteriota bacterium]